MTPSLPWHHLSAPAGLGTIPFILNAELFLPEAQSLGGSLSMCLCWLWTVVIPLAFIPLEEVVGVHGMFMAFAVVTAVGEEESRKGSSSSALDRGESFQGMT